jgi:glycosyltransferase involved in cell wall biosynthesis
MGRLREEASALDLSDAVEFTGLVGDPELSRFYLDCDAFVLPAVEDSKGDVEGLGVVLLEAMAHDRPVIASASGGIPDIVVDEATGLLTKPGDVDSLVEAIERLASDAGLRARLAATARDHVAKHFSWNRIIDQLQELYVEIAPPALPRFHHPSVTDNASD